MSPIVIVSSILVRLGGVPEQRTQPLQASTRGDDPRKRLPGQACATLQLLHSHNQQIKQDLALWGLKG